MRLGTNAIGGAVALGAAAILMTCASLRCAAADFSGAVVFDGGGDYVNLGNDSRLKPSAALTVEAWAHSSDWTAPGRLISCRQGAGYALSTAGTGSDKLGGEVNANGAYLVVGISNAEVASGWHHFALTYDGQYVKFYLDGRLTNSKALDGTHPISYHATNSVLLAADPGAGDTPENEYFTGTLDEVRIWESCRTEQEIRQTMMTPLSGDEPGLVAYYPADETSGSALPNDVAGGPAAGVLHGDTQWVDSGIPPDTLWVDDDYAEGADNDGHRWGYDAFSSIGAAVSATRGFSFPLAYHTIIVKDGTYAGSANRDINFYGRLLTIRAENGPESTTIDCENAGRAFEFGYAETAEARIEGFTISNGTADRGGAILCGSGTGPTIADCRFVDNGATARGGAIMAADSSAPVIQGCEFRGNSAEYAGGVNVGSGSSVELQECSFIENSASQHGGAIHIWQNATATIEQTSFDRNTAYYNGGAIYCLQSSATISGCDFTENRCTAGSGAGIFFWETSAPILRRCRFTANQAAGSAGGVYCGQNVGATISNCLFVSNHASTSGGGLVFVQCSSLARAINCTAAANSAGSAGGGVYCQSSTPTLTNVVFSGNMQGAVFEEDSASDATRAVNCLFHDNPDGDYKDAGAVNAVIGAAAVNELDSNTGNVDGDPRFRLPPGGLQAPDLHLTHGSAAIDRGTNTGAPVTDMDGEPRPWNDTADIGADEFVDTDMDRLADTHEPALGTDPSLADTDGDGDPDGAEVIWGSNPLDPQDTLPRRFVDAGAPAGGDGTSWENAFNSVQDAIDALDLIGMGNVWMAGGTYKPTTGNDRSASFVMADNVALYGGFAGNETLLRERDVAANPTILSADIGVAGDAGDNCYHVVVFDAVLDARLDGFTVTGGQGTDDVESPDGVGGGIHCSNGAARVYIANCRITGNFAEDGGGIYVGESSLRLENCAIEGNEAARDGGGVACHRSSVTFTDCNISLNRGSGAGAGIDSSYCSLFFTNCTLHGNEASWKGGAVYCYETSVDFMGCAFTSNTADLTGNGEGGAGYFHRCTVDMQDCIVNGNSCGFFGGGICFDNCETASLTNCVLVDNVAADGKAEGGAGALQAQSYWVESLVTLTHCTISNNRAPWAAGIEAEADEIRLQNCILWNDTGGEVKGGGTITVEYSIVKGGYSGNGNLDADPLFKNAANGNYAIQYGSPAINAGTLAPNPLEKDVAGNPRDPHPDIGAYEYLFRQRAIDLADDGSGDGYVTLPVPRERDGTLELWYYVMPFGQEETIFDSGASDPLDWRLFISDTGVATFRLASDCLLTCDLGPLGGGGRWYHFAVCTWLENDAMSASLIVNGVERATAGNKGWALTGEFYLGGGRPGNPRGRGAVDEVRFWGTKRSIDELRAAMFRPPSEGYPYMDAYYVCNGEGTSLLMDRGNYGRHGTLVNLTEAAWIPSTIPFGDDGRFVDTQSPTGAGVTGRDIGVTLTRGGDGTGTDYLGVYVTGNGESVISDGETFPPDVTERRNIVWGIAEFGDVRADIRIDCSAISDVGHLLFREDPESPWTAYSSDPPHTPGTFLLSGETVFGQFSITEQSVPPSAGPNAEDTIDNNADVTLTLGGYDPDGDPLTANVTKLPARGTLYQYAPDSRGRGNAIDAPGTVITDEEFRVVYAPANAGHYTATVEWTVSDGVNISAKATCTLSITDVIPPGVTLSGPLTTTSSPFLVNATLNEPCPDFVDALQVNGGTLGTPAATDGGYEFPIMPDAVGPVVISIDARSFHDLAGQTNPVGETLTVEYVEAIPLQVSGLTIEVDWTGNPYSPGAYNDHGNGEYTVFPPYRINGLILCPPAGQPLDVQGTALTGGGPLELDSGFQLLSAGQRFTLDADTGVLIPTDGGPGPFSLNASDGPLQLRELHIPIPPVPADLAHLSLCFQRSDMTMWLTGGVLQPGGGIQFESSRLDIPNAVGGGTSGANTLFVNESNQVDMPVHVEFCLAGDQGITLPKTNWALSELCFFYDSGPPESWGGAITAGIPAVGVPGIQGKLGFAQGRLQMIRLAVTGLNAPIGTTGAMLDSVGVGARNLARIPTCITVEGVPHCSVPPLEFFGDVGITAGPSFLGMALVRGTLEGVISENGFSLVGGVYIFIFQVGGGELAIMWSGPEKGVSGNAWVYWYMIIRGEAYFALSEASQSVGARAALRIPNGFPLIGGRNFGSAHLGYVSSPRQRVSGSVRWSFKVFWTRFSVRIAFHLDSGGFGFGSRDRPAIICRDWETPFMTVFEPPADANGRDGALPGVLTFCTNFEQQQKVYRDSGLMRATRDGSEVIQLTLTSRHPTFIRLTYQEETANPEFTVETPGGMTYTPADVFDPNAESQAAHYLANAEAREAEYLVFPGAESRRDADAFTYTVRVLHPETLGEYGIEVLVQNETPSLSVFDVETPGPSLNVTWQADDPDDDDAEVAFFLDTDRANADGVRIGDTFLVDGLPHQEQFDLSTETFGAGVYWLYAQLYDGHSLSDPMYSKTPVVIADVDAPPAPRNVEVAISADSALVTWAPPEDRTGRELFSYKVLWTADPAGQTYQDFLTVPSTETSAHVAGLSPNTRYRFTVRSVDKVERSTARRAARFALFADAQEALRRRRNGAYETSAARAVLDDCAADRGGLPPDALQALAEQLVVSARIADIQERYVSRPRGLLPPTIADAGHTTQTPLREEQPPPFVCTESIQTETVVVYTAALSGANNHPVIQSTPPDLARVGQTYNYVIDATDDDGDPIQYVLHEVVADEDNPLSETLVPPPSGMNMMFGNRLNWTPEETQAGLHKFRLVATDSHGASTEQRWHVTVTTMPSVRPLAFLNSPACDWQAGETFHFYPTLNREDLSNVTWELVTGPAGMAVDPITGTLSWPIPARAEPSSEHHVILIAREHEEETALDFYLNIQTDNPPVTLTREWEEPPVVVTVTETNESTHVTESGTGDTYVVTLTDLPEEPVTVTLVAGFPLDLGSGPGMAHEVVFPAETGASQHRTVFVQAVADPAETQDYDRTITHTVASQDPRYDGLPVDPLTVSVAKAVDTAPAGQLQVSGGVTATNTRDVVLTVALDAGADPAVDMRFSNDGLRWSAWESFATTKSWSLSDGDGSKEVHLQLRDVDGDISGTISDQIRVDTDAPRAPAVGASATVTDNRRPTWTWQGQGGGNGTYRYQLDGESTGAWTASADKVFTPDADLADGEHVLYVQERDNAGNWSASGSYGVNVDSVAPTPPQLSGRSRVNNDTAKWNWSAEGKATVCRYRLAQSRENWMVTTGPAVSPPTLLTEGDYVIEAQAGDAAGNWSGSGPLWYFTVDLTPPTTHFTALDPVTEQFPHHTEAREVVVAVEAADTAGEPIAGWLLTETPHHPRHDAAGWLGTEPGTYILTSPPGRVTVYAWVQDEAGNVSALTANSHRDIILDPAMCIMRLLLPEAQIPELYFGHLTDATINLDEGIDVVAPEALPGAGPCVVLLNQKIGDSAKQRLGTDMRESAALTRWRLLVPEADRRNGLSLSWDVSAASPEKRLYLQRLVDEYPAGSPIDMLENDTAAIAGGDVFEIAYAEPAEVTFSLQHGWNLLGIPVMTTTCDLLRTAEHRLVRSMPLLANPVLSTQSAVEILEPTTREAVHNGFVWYWNENRYQTRDDGLPLSPERGYWVYCSAENQSATVHGIRADGLMVVQPEWNLISPAADCIMPVVPGIASPAWYWDNGLQTYHAVASGGTLEAGCGYWVYVTSPDPVTLALPGE